MFTRIVELSLRVTLMSSANRLAHNGAPGDTLPARLLQSDKRMKLQRIFSL